MPIRPFDGFYQLTYVTTDFDRGLERLSARYGVADLETSEVTLELDEGDDVTIRCGLVHVGPLQVELVEPVGDRDAIYRDALPDDGSFAVRWHHTGFLVENATDLAQVRADLDADGHPVVLSGVNPGVARFVHLDARPMLGHHLEYFALER